MVWFITDNCISLPFDKVLSIDMVDRKPLIVMPV